MREYDIYLPTQRRDGQPVEEGEILRIKQGLTDAFGGYTHFRSRSEGAWRMAGVTFQDEITILRVLDDGTTPFDLPAFKRDLQHRLDQESILIVCRQVEIV